MRGRKPKPTKLKLVEGNPGKRPINKREPQPKGPPRMPRVLSPAARKQWRKIAGKLSAFGVATNVDEEALALLCEAWARWIDAEEHLRKFGVVVKSPKSGFPMPSPYLAICNTAMKQIKDLLVEFGCTPSSRTRLKAAQEDWSDPDGVLNGEWCGSGRQHE